jgi:hypothetical protein
VNLVDNIQRNVADGNVCQQAGEAYTKMPIVTQGQNLMRQAGYLNFK